MRVARHDPPAHGRSETARCERAGRGVPFPVVPAPSALLRAAVPLARSAPRDGPTRRGDINARFPSTPTRDRRRSLALLAASPRPRACACDLRRVLTNGPLTAKREGSSTTLLLSADTVTRARVGKKLQRWPMSRRKVRSNLCHGELVAAFKSRYGAAERVPNTQGTIKLGFTQSGTRCVNCN